MKYNRQLRQISREMYNLNGIYANTVDYYASLPTLDFITIASENKKSVYKKRKLLNRTLKKINHKLTIRDIIFSLLIDGIYIGIFRNTKANNKKINSSTYYIDSLESLEGLSLDDNIMIQPLNKDYVKIIGFQNNDFVAAFDMMYFDQFKHGGLLHEIKNYPIEFAKGYIAYRKDASKRWLILPQNKTVALKFKSSINEPYGRPLGISALTDILFDEQYTDSQRSNIAENANTIRYLVQPEGEKKGQCSLNSKQQQAQYDNFKSAIFSTDKNKIAKTTTLVLAPGTDVGKLENDNTLMKDTLTEENMKKISTSIGFASAALNGSGDGAASYSSLQVNIDLVLAQVFQILEQIQWQFTKVLNYLVKSKPEEAIDVIYLKTSILNRQKDFNIAKDLYTDAGGSRLWLYAVGTGDVDTYMSLMEYEKEMKFDEKYLPHQTSYTISGNDSGRPENDATTNPNSLKGKTNNSNMNPSPSDG